LRELTAEQQRIPTISSIQKAVAEFYGVRVDDMRSRGRNKSIVLPRQVAMYLCRQIVKASLPDIGEGFGGKDHSTVIHSLREGEENDRRRGRVSPTGGRARRSRLGLGVSAGAQGSRDTNGGFPTGSRRWCLVGAESLAAADVLIARQAGLPRLPVLADQLA